MYIYIYTHTYIYIYTHIYGWLVLSNTLFTKDTVASVSRSLGVASQCLPLASCFPVVFQIFVSHLSSSCLAFALQVVNGGTCLPACSRRVFPNVFHCLSICFLLFPHNVQLSPRCGPPIVFRLHSNCFPVALVASRIIWPCCGLSITSNYLHSQLCPLALILNAFEIVTAAVGLQSWVDELSIQVASSC